MFLFKSILLISCLIFFFINTCSSQNRKNAQSTLDDRISELNKLSLKKSIIRLNPSKFKYLVKSIPKNYTVIVMMTAMSSHRQCQVCRAAHDEFLIVANSWRFSNQFNSQLYFASVDFDEGSEVFQQLNINSAPVFLHFSPTSVRNVDTMDIQRIGFTAEAIAKWIFEKSEIRVRIIRPPSFIIYSWSIIFVLFASFIIYIKRNNLECFYNRNSWGIISLLIVFTMTSGQVWNHIRGPPLKQRTSKGNFYVHSSTNGQYVIETYIVMWYNAAIVIGMILMNEALKIKGDLKKKKIMVVLGFILTSIFFSALISIFRKKAQAYPYSFFFK